MNEDEFAPTKPRSKPRRMTLLDMPWLSYLGRKRYPKKFDAEMTEQWFRVNVLPNPLMYYACRTDNAFCIVFVTTFPWLPADPELNLSFLCADEGAIWEAVDCYRDCLEFAKRRGVKKWDIGSITDYNLRSIAKRIGANEERIHYRGDV